MNDSKPETGSIDSAIKELNEHARHHRLSSQRILTYLGTASIALLGFFAASFFWIQTANQSFPFPLVYGAFAIYIMVFGVLMAIYRFHLNEISRAEHFIIGFMRIRVAANNANDEGFKSEVRDSLTDGAFSHHSIQQKGVKNRSVESPVPGYPTSDVTTMVLNKLLEGLEVRRKS